MPFYPASQIPERFRNPTRNMLLIPIWDDAHGEVIHVPDDWPHPLPKGLTAITPTPTDSERIAALETKAGAQDALVAKLVEKGALSQKEADSISVISRDDVSVSNQEKLIDQ